MWPEVVVASRVFDVDDILDDVTYRRWENVVTIPDNDLVSGDRLGLDDKTLASITRASA